MTARDELIDYLAKNASAADGEKYGLYVSPDDIREATDMVDAAIKEAVQPAEAELAENASVMQALRRQRDHAEAQVAAVRAYADSLYSADRKIDACGVREKLYELMPMGPVEHVEAGFRWHVLSQCPDETACPIHGRDDTEPTGPEDGVNLPELTAEDAVEAMEDMATDLYKAEDRLAFIAEMCDLADREQRQVTTEQVRAWSQYTGCGGAIVLPEDEQQRLKAAMELHSLTGRIIDRAQAERWKAAGRCGTCGFDGDRAGCRDCNGEQW